MGEAVQEARNRLAPDNAVGEKPKKK